MPLAYRYVTLHRMHVSLVVVTALVVLVGPVAPGNEHEHHFITCNASSHQVVLDLYDYDVVVVGAGLSGAVLAQNHVEFLQQRVLVLEKRNHSAGNTCVRL